MQMAIRSLRKMALRALGPLQSSSSIPATQNSSLFSLSYYSAKSSTSASYSRPNLLFNSISCRRLSYLNEESHGPAAVDYGRHPFTKPNSLEMKPSSLQVATSSLDSSLQVILPNTDSTVVAVKKLENINQGEKQFRAEVSTIGTIHHVNLVRLLGFCREGEKQLLVYEYMKKGSLDSYLFNAKESNSLNWKMRYKIALGIARGLEYLHDKCRDCIIHCDIKPQNILLDTEFRPKVGDFGLAKLVGRDFSRVLTTMRGTRGYLAPEWLSGVAITAKADVYSYGMMLFELVSGRRNTEPLEDESVKFFPSLAANVTVNGGDVVGLLDPSLNRNADEEEVWRLCKVACWCVQDDENMRPSMSRVVQILEGVMDVSLPPIPQSLRVLLAARQEHILFFTDSSNAASSEV